MDEEYLEDIELEDVTAQTDADIEYADLVNKKIELYQNMDNMSSRDRSTFIKLIQMDVLNDALDAACNLKKTPESVWKNVISRMNAIKGLKNSTDRSGFDFNKLLDKLIPAIGLLAGTLIALRQAEKAEIDADTIDDEAEILKQEKAALTQKAKAEAMKLKSIVLQYCDTKENGFSNNAD